MCLLVKYVVYLYLFQTNPMGQIPSWEANSSSVSQEIPRILWNPKFNLLTPNVNYSGRTAPLTSEVTFYIFIQQI